jgi:hypothetical protein
MKLPFLLFTLASIIALPVRAEISPVRMTVELATKTSAAPKDPHDKTQTRSLKISLFNNSAEAFDGLVVKYWFVGHAEGSHDTKVLKEGERKSTLTPRGKDVIDSEAASAHFVEEHYQVAKGGKGGKPTKVPASGEKMTGHAVRVMKDTKILAEYYSEPSVKNLIK